MTNQTAHISVMPEEAMTLLQPAIGEWLVDATLGSGGHTQRLLEAGAKVCAVDWDQAAIQQAQTLFAREIATGQLVLIHDTFARLGVAWSQHPSLAPQRPMGILFDFGTSTQQLMSSERGFSFTGTGPLDMRMDTRRGVTAADLLNALTERQLADLLGEYGGEPEARRIAAQIKAALPITSAAQLGELVAKTKRRPTGKLHPATRVFQALRIAVNTETEEIAQALPEAEHLLAAGGRIVAISFHEGEDRIVKRLFRAWTQAGQGNLLTKKPLVPSPEEVEHNPRARSAKLRAYEKGNTL